MMSDEKNQSAPEKDSPGIAPDPLEELALEMFLCEEVEALANLDDSELESLAKLGRSAAPAEHSAAAEETAIPGYRQLELPTMRDYGETVLDPVSSSHSQQDTEEYRELVNALERLDQLEKHDFPFDCERTAELGRGGQGVVYRVEGTDEFSAVQAMKIFFPKTPADAAYFAADMDRIKSIATLIQHAPHDDLVDVHWFGERHGVFAMLMQYIDGFDLQRLVQPDLRQSLKQCVTKKRWLAINDVVYSMNGSRQLALQPAIAVYIIERVLRGCEHIHRKGIVHGDIKPSNIMLNDSGSVKIIDVGSAFEISSPPVFNHFTPAYAAPEFLESGKMSMQSDLASIGYMLLELLSGKSIAEGICDPDESTTTFAGFNREELIESKISLPHRLDDYLPAKVMESDQLVELCRRLIDPDLNKRFPSAAEGIVHHKGTYQFNKDLIRGDLGVCNFYEVSQWLEDVKQATKQATR